MNIRHIRKQNGISQDKLAKLADIAQPYLSEIEAGKKVPSITVALRIAKALNCEIQEIIQPETTTKQA